MSRVILDMAVRWVPARICHIREHYPNHPQWFGENYTYGVVSYDNYDTIGVASSTSGDLRWIGL